MVRGITATAAVMGPPRSSGPCPAMMLESQDGRKARLHAICSSWCTPELCQHAWLPAVSRLVLCCLEAVPGRPGLTTDAAAARRSCATACARCARQGWCPPSTRPTRQHRAPWWTSALVSARSSCLETCQESARHAVPCLGIHTAKLGRRTGLRACSMHQALRGSCAGPSVQTRPPAPRFADLMDLSRDRSRLDFFLRPATSAPPAPARQGPGAAPAARGCGAAAALEHSPSAPPLGELVGRPADAPKCGGGACALQADCTASGGCRGVRGNAPAVAVSGADAGIGCVGGSGAPSLRSMDERADVAHGREEWPPDAAASPDSWASEDEGAEEGWGPRTGCAVEAACADSGAGEAEARRQACAPAAADACAAAPPTRASTVRASAAGDVDGMSRGACATSAGAASEPAVRAEPCSAGADARPAPAVPDEEVDLAGVDMAEQQRLWAAVEARRALTAARCGDAQGGPGSSHRPQPAAEGGCGQGGPILGCRRNSGETPGSPGRQGCTALRPSKRAQEKVGAPCNDGKRRQLTLGSFFVRGPRQ